MKIILSLVMALGFGLGNLTAGFGAEAIKLPPPATKGTVSVEEALQNRRSTRKFGNRSLELAQISQLLWATDGINNPPGKRTAPSGRAAYSIDLYLVAGQRGVTNQDPGVCIATWWRTRPWSWWPQANFARRWSRPVIPRSGSAKPR